MGVSRQSLVETRQLAFGSRDQIGRVPPRGIEAPRLAAATNGLCGSADELGVQRLERCGDGAALGAAVSLGNDGLLEGGHC